MVAGTAVAELAKVTSPAAFEKAQMACAGRWNAFVASDPNGCFLMTLRFR